MLFLQDTDLLKVVTSSTATTDVHISWVDALPGSSTVTPGRTNTAITTATTTTVLTSPNTNYIRTVKTMTVRNKHASSSVDITVQHVDNVPFSAELEKVTLAAGEQLHYDEHGGFTVKDALGRLKLRNDNLVTTASPAYLTVVLGSDVTNSTTSYADVTALSFPVVSGNTYWFRFFIPFTAALATTGSRWSINGPAITALYYRSDWSSGTATRQIADGLSTYDAPATASTASAATTSNIACIEGVYTAGANGSVIARFAAEVASAIVAKAGALVHYEQVI